MNRSLGGGGRAQGGGGEGGRSPETTAVTAPSDQHCCHAKDVRTHLQDAGHRTKFDAWIFHINPISPPLRTWVRPAVPPARSLWPNMLHGRYPQRLCTTCHCIGFVYRVYATAMLHPTGKLECAPQHHWAGHHGINVDIILQYAASSPPPPANMGEPCSTAIPTCSTSAPRTTIINVVINLLQQHYKHRSPPHLQTWVSPAVPPARRGAPCAAARPSG